MVPALTFVDWVENVISGTRWILVYQVRTYSWGNTGTQILIPIVPERLVFAHIIIIWQVILSTRKTITTKSIPGCQGLKLVYSSAFTCRVYRYIKMWVTIVCQETVLSNYAVMVFRNTCTDFFGPFVPEITWTLIRSNVVIIIIGIVWHAIWTKTSVVVHNVINFRITAAETSTVTRLAVERVETVARTCAHLEIPIKNEDASTNIIVELPMIVYAIVCCIIEVLAAFIDVPVRIVDCSSFYFCTKLQGLGSHKQRA